MISLAHGNRDLPSYFSGYRGRLSTGSNELLPDQRELRDAVDRVSYRPRIVLADDHLDILDEAGALLEPDFEIVSSVRDGQALLKAVIDTRPDCVVADVEMPSRTVSPPRPSTSSGEISALQL